MNINRPPPCLPKPTPPENSLSLRWRVYLMCDKCESGTLLSNLDSLIQIISNVPKSKMSWIESILLKILLIFKCKIFNSPVFDSEKFSVHPGEFWYQKEWFVNCLKSFGKKNHPSNIFIIWVRLLGSYWLWDPCSPLYQSWISFL